MFQASRALRLRFATIVALTPVVLLAADPARAESCRASVGDRQAARLVAHCIAVSPATRPPCNAANACDLIEAEIARGCGMLGEDAPDFCRSPRR